MSPTDSLAAVGGVYAALAAAHQIGDYWLQTEGQASCKGLPGARGWVACATHVATLTATKGAALAALGVVTGWAPDPGWAVLGLGLDAAAHAWADRRWTLHRLARAAERAGVTGKTAFWAHAGAPRPGRDDNPCLGTGAHALDQAFHHAWLFVAALVITTT